ncbi:hypothetical protein I3760_13G167000 [Carya illinoinensis]|nr:hypothetical protein I3760_13G167000 [Carya illinoinensis]
MGNDLCPVCKLHKESVMHVLWQCVASSDVWIESSARIQKWRISEDNFLDLIEKMAQILSKEEMEEVAMVMRSIWLRRNQLVFDNKFIPPRQLINLARVQLREFQRAKSVTVHTNSNRRLMKQEGWKKPTAGNVKVNWDAALDQKRGIAGLEIVIRDEMGEVLTACCDQRLHVRLPAMAECLALWKALELCRDLGFCRVLFEGDAQVIIKAVNEENSDYPLYGSIGWKIQYVQRSSNGVAHRLAKEALHIDTEIIWMEDSPSCIAECIEKDKRCNSDNVH